MTDDVTLAVGEARVRVSTASGRITIVGEARDDIVVTTDDRRDTTAASAGVEVTTASDSVEVRCPVGTDVVVGSASGRVRLEGQLGAARVTTASGSIRVGSVSSADLRTQSARIEVERCLGTCRVMNKSGKVEVHRARDVHVEGVSGTIEVAGDEVRVRTVSGRVRVGTNRSAAIESVSGSVDVRVPEGFRPHVRRQGQGRVDVDVPEGDDGDISIRTVSASVRVRTR